MKAKPASKTRTARNKRSNGQTSPKQRFSLNELRISNATMRQAWLRKLMDPRKDIDAECGHPEDLSIEDYQRMFERGDVANRVVTLYPEETWSEDPQVFETEEEDETEFETAWNELVTGIELWSYMLRADVLSGIGRFGILLLGFNDGKLLHEPVESADELMYVRPFGERHVNVSSLVTDVVNPRYGMPDSYSVTFSDTALQSGSAAGAGTGATSSTATGISVNVHHSRIVHMADNRLESDVYGLPRMQCVMNRLLDLRKIAGGSGEMFWKGGFPGLSLEALNVDDNITIDQEATEAQMDKYMNGLQRYIALTGMQAKSLAPQVADPKGHVETQLRLIATAMAVPWRIFIGSEAAQLAAQQDSTAWNKRLNRRRENYVTPFVIRPFIERCMAVGVLPETPIEELRIDWSDLNTPSEEQKSKVAKEKTEAMSKYVQGGVDMLIPPFEYLTLVMGMKDDEARTVIDIAEKNMDDKEAEEEQKQLEENERLQLEIEAGRAQPQQPPRQGPQPPTE